MKTAEINAALRRDLPGVHRWARHAVNTLFAKHPSIPCPALPRRIAGNRVWVHPRFCTTPLDVEPHVRAWLAAFLHPGSTFFDVGSYVGWHSIYAAQIVGRTGSVVAFEASQTNAYYLDFHRRKNQLAQIKVVAAAVSDRTEGTLTLHMLNDGDSTSNSIQCGEAYTRSQANQMFSSATVPTTSLDANMAFHQPDLVKIDVEGAELLVLSGAKRLLSERRPPIILAIHPEWLPNKAEPGDIIRLLHEFEYELFEPRGGVPAALHFADYLCLPMECRDTRHHHQKRS